MAMFDTAKFRHIINNSNFVSWIQNNTSSNMTIEKPQNPYDIKIGMLVFVKTYSNLSTYYASTPTVKLDYFTHDELRNITTTTVSPNTTGTSTCIPYDNWDEGTYKDVKYDYRCNIEPYRKSVVDNTSEIDDLKNFLLNDVDDTFPNKLGMASMSDKNKNDFKIKSNGSSNSKWTIKSNSTSNINSSTNITVTGNTFALEEKVFARGFKTLPDYLHGIPEKIEQEEKWTEKEIENFSAEGNFNSMVGKPFNGIIVDRLNPYFTSENGEEITAAQLGFPRMYKVLFGDKNVLWFEEENVFPMKPNKCPMKPKPDENNKAVL